MKLIVQIIQINLVLKNPAYSSSLTVKGSNNTNKLSPQEHSHVAIFDSDSSNNTNKLSPQELG